MNGRTRRRLPHGSPVPGTLLLALAAAALLTAALGGQGGREGVASADAVPGTSEAAAWAGFGEAGANPAPVELVAAGLGIPGNGQSSGGSIPWWAWWIRVVVAINVGVGVFQFIAKKLLKAMENDPSRVRMKLWGVASLGVSLGLVVWTWKLVGDHWSVFRPESSATASRGGADVSPSTQASEPPGAGTSSERPAPTPQQAPVPASGNGDRAGHDNADQATPPARAVRLHETSVSRLQSLAQGGHPGAQVELGQRYLRAGGPDEMLPGRDLDQAATWFRAAAQRGSLEGQFELGRMYLRGFGVARDDGTAVQWLRRAAERGQPEAQVLLGNLYKTEGAESARYGRDVRKNDETAAMWFGRAAEEGAAAGQYWLGRMYERGAGVPRDLGKAASWYGRAAEQGVQEAREARDRLAKGQRQQRPARVVVTKAAPRNVTREKPVAAEPAQPAGPIHVSGAVTKPVRLKFVEPRYTRAARRMRVTGTVVLQATIDKTGKVTNVEALKGLGLGLTEAAVAAVKQWRYEPATLNGKPIAVYYQVTVHFRL